MIATRCDSELNLAATVIEIHLYVVDDVRAAGEVSRQRFFLLGSKTAEDAVGGVIEGKSSPDRREVRFVSFHHFSRQHGQIARFANFIHADGHAMVQNLGCVECFLVELEFSTYQGLIVLLIRAKKAHQAKESFDLSLTEREIQLLILVPSLVYALSSSSLRREGSRARGSGRRTSQNHQDFVQPLDALVWAVAPLLTVAQR